MKKLILKTLTRFNMNLRNSTNHAPSLRASLLIMPLIACFGLLPTMAAAPGDDTGAPDALGKRVMPVQPAPAPETPDPGSVGGSLNTADGTNGLGNVTTGIANSAFGWFSLFSNTDGSFNTAVGAGTLVLNVGDQTTGDGLENTAVGTAALLFNTTGSQNTGVGVLALENNASGSVNTAIGWHTLMSNIDGNSNTAVGRVALMSHQTGSFNTSIGNQTLEDHTSGSGNVAMGSVALGSLMTGDNNVGLGRFAGSGLTSSSNVICLGFNVDGISTTNGELSDSCYIGNIVGAGVDAGTAVPVFVDQDGKLGTTALPNTGNLPSAQTFSGKVHDLETTVAKQAKAIEILTAQLKEQARQIQKVSAQLELRTPAAQVANYKQ
jgi:hypothetical protein